MATVDLSDKVERDGSCAIVNANSVYSAAYRGRNFRYYKVPFHCTLSVLSAITNNSFLFIYIDLLTFSALLNDWSSSHELYLNNRDKANQFHRTPCLFYL